MTDIKIYYERLWETGWYGHEMAQLKRMARLSFQEKIIWLEEAQEMMQKIEPLRHPPSSRSSHRDYGGTGRDREENR